MSKIEWTDETWNPIIGCSKVSEGCNNCYAEKMAFRLMRMNVDGYEFVLDNNGMADPEEFRYIPQWNGQTHLVKSALKKPYHWKKPRKIFVCSMGDLFHGKVPFEWIDKVMDVITSNPQHTFQILTKRPERMKQYFEYYYSDGNNYLAWVNNKIPNLWIGVSVENQKTANERIPVLLQIPAVKHFISIEPMLGAIDLEDITFPVVGGDAIISVLECDVIPEDDEIFHGKTLDWVILGGETGPKARPMHPDWVKSILRQCKDAGVTFFFKSWGEWAKVSLDIEQKLHEKYIVFGVDGKEYLIAGAHLNPAYLMKLGKKKSGNQINRVQYQEFPKK